MIDIQTFLSFKNMNDDNIINEKLEQVISLLGIKKNIKNNKITEKHNTIKNPSIQILKDKIENKVNLVLNKLSENNFNNLLIEFVENINKITENEFILVQQTFYTKMQSEINFVKIYLEFFKIIASLYNDVFNFNSMFFYSIVETKFQHDYYNMILTPEYEFLSDYDEESKRINNHIIIKNMVINNMFKPELIDIINNSILEQSVHYADIYYWFQNTNITPELEQKIKNKIDISIKNNVLPSREKILLEDLVNIKHVNKQPNKQVNKQIIEQPVNINNMITNVPISVITIDNGFKEVVKQKTAKKTDKIDTLQLEVENMIEEYLSIDSYNDIILFIDERCKDAISKNKFCQFAFYKYFEAPPESGKHILELLKQLIKKQSLFKSNLSRGLLLLYTKWNEVQVDYSNPGTKLKDLLIYLKNIGITKNLEHLLKANKIDFSNE
jgi:hypothetical protein